MKHIKPDDVRQLSKGGYLLQMKPEDCPSMLGWIGTLSKNPETVRFHPPAGSTNNSELTVLYTELTQQYLMLTYVTVCFLLLKLYNDATETESPPPPARYCITTRS